VEKEISAPGLSRDSKDLKVSLEGLKTRVHENEAVSTVNVANIDNIIQTLYARQPLLASSKRYSDLIQSGRNKAYKELFQGCSLESFNEMKTFIVKVSGLLLCLVEVFMISQNSLMLCDGDEDASIDPLIKCIKMVYHGLDQ
jgi:hypothetical protein